MHFGFELFGFMNPRGMSALHMASIYGKEDIVDLLLDNNATVDIWSGQGFTPLMLASGEGHLNIIEKLLTKVG